MNFGLQHMGRKSIVCAHNTWGVSIKVLTSVNNALWCAVRKPLLYPPIELRGRRGSAWWEIKPVQLVTDFMGRVYVGCFACGVTLITENSALRPMRMRLLRISFLTLPICSG
jgi:hypothetical protein